jgi:hypothetical protein
MGPAALTFSDTPSANCLKFALKRRARWRAFSSYAFGFAQVFRGPQYLTRDIGAGLRNMDAEDRIGAVGISASVPFRAARTIARVSAIHPLALAETPDQPVLTSQQSTHGDGSCARAEVRRRFRDGAP